MTEDELQSLRNLVNYSWSAEEADYDEQDDEGKRTHIFLDLELLEQFLERHCK